MTRGRPGGKTGVFGKETILNRAIKRRLQDIDENNAKSGKRGQLGRGNPGCEEEGLSS